MLKVDIKRTLPGFKLDVSFSLNHEIMAVLGASGSGKTMTLQCIAGLLQPDSGRIELNGKVLFDSSNKVSLQSQKRKVGFVFQNYALFPHLTVVENIAYGIHHLPHQQAKSRVRQLLEIMHVTALEKRYPRQLSAGQQQRVAIARALAPDPEVLLFDEPFSALDTQLKERLELEMLALQQHYKGSMLLVTHDLAEGYKLGDKIAIYQSGNIIQFDSKRNVFAYPANRTVARLTGIRNLMDGIITELQDGSAWVSIPAWGRRLKVQFSNPIPLVTGQRVTIGIRPEYIRLTADSGLNILSSRILQAAEGISSITYRFQVNSDLAGKHLLNSTISKSDAICLDDGEICQVCLPPEHLILIPESTNSSI
jgi:molybdate transport system ATP-binding protein